MSSGATSVSNELTTPEGRTLTAAGTSPVGAIQLHTVSLDSAQLGQQTTVKGVSLLSKDGTPTQISNLFLTAGSAGLPYGTSAGASSSAPLVGLTAMDGTVVLTRGEHVVWKREEALAEVSGVLFVDLPADAKAGDRADASHKQTSIMDHIHFQILSLKVSDGCSSMPQPWFAIDVVVI